jgi:hypothetical protein
MYMYMDRCQFFRGAYVNFRQFFDRISLLTIIDVPSMIQNETEREKKIKSHGQKKYLAL